MNRESFTNTARDRFTQAREFWSTWQTEARDDYRFVSGEQWLDDDKAILTEQKRPPITFNYSEKMVDAVVGAEVSSRNEVTYLPRGLEDSPLAELWTNAARWVRDECNAEDEETLAFRDALICGLGWTHTRLSYDTDLDGKIEVVRIDPLEMLPDPAATRPGLLERRYHFHLYWIDESEVKRLWPGTVVAEEDPTASRGVVTQGMRYENDTSSDERDRHKGQVQLRFYECFERETIYRVAEGNEIIELSASEFAQIQDQLDQYQIPYAKQYKKVYYRAFFANDTLLQVDKSPCQQGYCYQAITAKLDRNRNTWYGILRVMKDPQRWANKWLSQILHIINTNAKGGLLAEIGAFQDPKKAQDEWAEPDSITLLREGGLNKVKEKTMSPYPAGLDKLMEFALGSLPMVTGINLEALGLANREQAGVLEAQRKQAAYGLLAPLFDALRRYRKNQGKILLDYIHNYISDGRLVRIGGPDSAQYLPLTKADKAIQFDIVVDQSPNAPDVKQKTWDTLNAILPAAMKTGMPIPPDILDYAPLPASLAAKWKKYIAENPPMGQDQAQQLQQQMQQAMQQVQKLTEENQKLKMDKTAEILDLKNKIELRQAEYELKKREIENKIALETYQADKQMELDRARASHDAAMKERQVKGDLRLKAISAQVNDDGEGGEGKPLGGLLMDDGEFKQTMQQMMQMMATTQQSNQQVLAELTQALSRPRKLITDAAGRPVGAVSVDKLN